MNIDGLSLEDVTRLFRLAERDVETLQAAVRKADAYAAFIEAELQAVSPECPDCLQIRRNRGGEPRAPAGMHQGDCPAAPGAAISDDCPCGHDGGFHIEGRCAATGCDCARWVVESFVERCAEAASTDEIKTLIGDYYGMGNHAGGSLHTVLDDGNTERAEVERCRKYATQLGDVAGVALADLLLRVDAETYQRCTSSNHE